MAVPATAAVAPVVFNQPIAVFDDGVAPPVAPPGVSVPAAAVIVAANVVANECVGNAGNQILNQQVVRLCLSDAGCGKNECAGGEKHASAGDHGNLLRRWGFC